RRMITQSDNPSTTYLVRVLSRERVNRAMADVGLRETHLAFRPQRGGALVGSTATAAEVAQLLAKLVRREVVSPAASNEMLLLLGASQRRKRIPAALPPHPGLWVGNKTGTLNGLVHDSAVVLDPAFGIRYTLTVFTEGARSEAAGQHVCIAVSRAVYEALRASVEHGARSTKHQAPSTEHQAPSTKHQAPSTEHGALRSGGRSRSASGLSPHSIVLRAQRSVLGASCSVLGAPCLVLRAWCS